MMVLAEGISFLTLLFIAMPMKYFLGMPEVVRVAGGNTSLRLLFRLEHLCWINNFGRKKQ